MDTRDAEKLVTALRDIIAILEQAPNCATHPMESAYEIGRAIGTAKFALIMSGNALPPRKPEQQ